MHQSDDLTFIFTSILLLIIYNRASSFNIINETSFNLCDKSSCQHDSECIEDESLNRGYRCVCKGYYGGELCETKLPSVISVVEPEILSRSSQQFWAHTVVADNGRDALLFRNISFEIRTNQGEGLLFLARDIHNNYLRIDIVNYFLEVTYSMGSNAFSEKTSCHLSANIDIWHRIFITNTSIMCNNITHELVDIRLPSKELISGAPTNVNVYVGNARKSAFLDEKIVNKQWYGCLRDLTFGNHKVPLILNEDDKGVVEGCEAGCLGDQRSYWSTCSGQGHCRERWNSSYTCSCWDSLFNGPNCNTDIGHRMSDQFNKFVAYRYKNLLSSVLNLKFAFSLYFSQYTSSKTGKKILFFAKGIPQNHFEIYIDSQNALVLNYSSPARPVVIAFKEFYIYQNMFYGVNVRFINLNENTNQIAIHVKLLNAEGQVIAQKRYPEKEPGSSTLYIENFFIGGKDKIKRPQEGYFDGCIQNFAIEFTDISGQRSYQIDWNRNNEQFTYYSNSEVDSKCSLRFPEPPSTTPTVTTPTTILTTTPNMSSSAIVDLTSPVVGTMNLPITSDISFGILIVIIMFGIVMILLSLVLLICVIRFCHRSNVEKKPNSDKFLDFTNTHSGYEKCQVNNTTVLSDIDDRLSMNSMNSSLASPVSFKPAYKAMSLLRNERSYLAQPDPEIDLGSADEQKETTFNNNLMRPESNRQQRSSSDYRITARARLYPAYRDSGYAGSFKSAQLIHSQLLVPQAQILACRLSALASPRVSMTTLPSISRKHPVTTL